jgi:hypothetical protein
MYRNKCCHSPFAAAKYSCTSRTSMGTDFYVQLVPEVIWHQRGKPDARHVLRLLLSERSLYVCTLSYRYSRVKKGEMIIVNLAVRSFSVIADANTNELTLITRSHFVSSPQSQNLVVKTLETRLVKGQGHTLPCLSCGFFDRFGLGCRHVYKIRDLPPKPEDASVRYRIDYLRYFNKPGFEELTACFNECLQNEPPGIPLCRTCAFAAVGDGDAPDDLLNASWTMQVDPKIRRGTHWPHQQQRKHISGSRHGVNK